MESELPPLPPSDDTLRLVVFAFIEPFGYRQITVWFRLKAFVATSRATIPGADET
jgi:hypothetical protein